MTQEQKDLLLKDLCARLPYGVLIVIQDTFEYSIVLREYHVLDVSNFSDIFCFNYKKFDKRMKKAMRERPNDIEIKPYLIPFSSMTEEQWMDTPYANLNKFTFDSFKCGCSTLAFETYEVNLNYVVEFINWCYKNHFDINGLIPMGLALEAPDGMYNQNI